MNRRSFLKTLAAGAAALIAPIPEPVKRPVRSVAQQFGIISRSPGYSVIDPSHFGITPTYVRVEAGEKLAEGDIVYLGSDGKAYKAGKNPVGVYSGNDLS